jgi:nucleoside-diphosphate-sugar epimerase
VKSILITGGEGYVGSALRLSLENYFSVDFCDIKLASNQDFDTVSINNYDAIIHLAAHSSVQLCDDFPKEAWKNNVTSFSRLLERLNKDQLLITASSASVYGITKGAADEKRNLDLPVKLYDTTKMVNDLMSATALASGKKIVSLRFGTIAGKSPNIRRDSVVNAMCYSALTSNQINVVNPEVRRSILFLPDLVDAILSILNDKLSDPGGVYNLSSINTDIQTIGTTVAKSLNHVEIKTSVGPSSNYDFHLNCNKFVNRFGEFRTSIFQSVIQDIIASAGRGQ